LPINDYWLKDLCNTFNDGDVENTSNREKNNLVPWMFADKYQIAIFQRAFKIG